MDEARIDPLTPVVCPHCRHNTRMLLEPETGKILRVYCVHCDWYQDPQPRRRAAIDPQAREDRRLVNDELQNIPQPTALVCRACGGALLARQRPGAKDPWEIVCQRCGRRDEPKVMLAPH